MRLVLQLIRQFFCAHRPLAHDGMKPMGLVAWRCPHCGKRQWARLKRRA